MALLCEDIIRRSLGRSMSDLEILDFADEARALANKARAARRAAGLNDPIRNHTRQHIRNKQLELMAHKRALDLQQATRLSAVSQAFDNFTGMEWEGISALLVGSKYARQGARLSVDSIRGGLTGNYLGGLLNDLEALGPETWQLFRKGKLEREIMEAMFTLDNNVPQFAGPPEALAIAKVINKWQETARVAENEAGAWIGKLPGYIMRQSHDADRIRRAGFESWRDEMLNRLDWDRTAGGTLAQSSKAERVAFLQDVFSNIITGLHEKTPTYELNNPRIVGSLAARVSRERMLHFKSGSYFYEYNSRFGRGTLIDGIIAGLSKSASHTALMRVFGPSPQTNLDNMTKQIAYTYKARGDVDAIRKLNKAKGRLPNEMKQLDGSLNVGGNPTVAEVGRSIRALQSMAKLGGALISGFSDVPLLSQEFKYQGASYFKSLFEGLRLFSHGRGSLEQRRILSACGVFFDSMAGNLTARFSGQELPGKLSAMMNIFFRLNGLSFWTDSWKKAATLMMSHDLANLAPTPWAGLSKARQRVLGLYHIDEGLWDLLRKGPMKAADGRIYFTPELAGHIPAKELEAYMQAKGMLVSKERVEAYRTTVADRLRSYFKDRVQYAILEPDARTASILNQGQAAGTVTGELLRYCMQFKSFPAAFLQRTLGREIYGRGADTALRGLAQAIIPRNGELTGLAGMIVMTTIFGYLSMTTKELLAGKEPRPVFDSPEEFGKVLVASFVQGGGAGIYGDFLFGAKSRMGDDFLSTLAGPTMGTASSLVMLYKSARDGEDVESQTFRTIWNNLPGNNIFWARPASEHALLQSSYEYMNPGFHKRLRKRIRKENNQKFFIEPTIWDWAKHRHKKKKR